MTAKNNLNYQAHKISTLNQRIDDRTLESIQQLGFSNVSNQKGFSNRLLSSKVLTTKNVHGSSSLGGTTALSWNNPGGQTANHSRNLHKNASMKFPGQQ